MDEWIYDLCKRSVEKMSGYYSLREILGYNAKYNIVLSDRGRGKSWGAKWFLINQEGTFMCLYRQSSDMQFAMKDWLEPILKGDKEHEARKAEEFEWEGNDKEGWQLKMDGTVKGYFRYLTAVNHIKQEVFPDDLNWVWWDEFIPLAYKKLPGVPSEGDALRAIVKTIEHDTIVSREEKGLKPVRVLMFANPFTWNNPVLSYFKVKPRYGIHKVGPGIVCELLEPVVKEKKGKMTCDDFLGDEVNRNQGWKDQMAFIVQVPKGAVPEWSLRLVDKYFTIYKAPNGIRYVKSAEKHVNIESKYIYNTKYGTLDGLREDEENIDGSVGRYLKQLAYNGSLKYNDINCKFDFLTRIEY